MSDPDVIDIDSRTNQTETTPTDSMSNSNPSTDTNSSPTDTTPSADSEDEDTASTAPPADAVSDTSTVADSDDHTSNDTTESSVEKPPFAMTIQAPVLQDIVDVIKTLVDECKVHLNTDGLSIKAVDPANVGMVSLSLDDTACEQYTAPGDSVIGVNIQQLDDIVSMATADDIISLRLSTDHKLAIEFNSLSYTIALIDPDSVRQEPDIPDLDLPATVVVEGSHIDRGVNASDMVADHVRFTVSSAKETFRISATGDTDDVDLTVTDDELISLTAADADSLFDIEYLNDINRALPANKEVTVRLGDEFPTKIQFSIANGKGTVEFMLAPRIETE